MFDGFYFFVVINTPKFASQNLIADLPWKLNLKGLFFFCVCVCVCFVLFCLQSCRGLFTGLFWIRSNFWLKRAFALNKNSLVSEFLYSGGGRKFRWVDRWENKRLFFSRFFCHSKNFFLLDLGMMCWCADDIVLIVLCWCVDWWHCVDVLLTLWLNVRRVLLLCSDQHTKIRSTEFDRRLTMETQSKRFVFFVCPCQWIFVFRGRGEISMRQVRK